MIRKRRVRFPGSIAALLPVAAIAASLAGGLAGPSKAEEIQSRPPMAIASFGGAYTRGQMIAYIHPFRKSTGRWVNVIDYNGGLDEIRDQVESLNVKWDVVDVESSELVQGCREGLFETIDPAILPAAPDGKSLSEDFLPAALNPCGIGSVVWSTVIAYAPSAVGSAKPASLADFFDTDEFPGPRGLQRGPRVNLEWALMADGVAAGDVYQVLSTAEGLDRAFRLLNRIKRYIVWWERGSQPVSWLRSGRVTMTSAWNGRVYEATKERGLDAVIVWDGQVLDLDFWAIPKGSHYRQRALDFIAFASDSRRLARQVDLIAYGPARRSSMAFVSDEVQPHLPTNVANRTNALVINVDWWAKNNDRLQAAFDDWLTDRPLSELFYRSDGS